jgi:tetratricopeptide (TPR) repeat protein
LADRLLAKEQQARIDAEAQRSRAQRNFDRVVNRMSELHSRIYGGALLDLPPETRRILADDIVQYFQEIVTSTDEDKITRVQRAQAYLHLRGIHDREGKSDQVVDDCTQAIAILERLTTEYPLETVHWQELGQAHGILGLHLLRMGHTLQAIRECREAADAFRQAVKIRPSDFRGLTMGAGFLSNNPIEQLRAPDEAVSLARRAVELAPDLDSAWHSLGYAEYRAGNWRASIEALQKSLEAGDPGIGSYICVCCYFSMSHWKLGERDQALKWFERANERMKAGRPVVEDVQWIVNEAAALLSVPDLPDDVFAWP